VVVVSLIAARFKNQVALPTVFQDCLYSEHQWNKPTQRRDCREAAGSAGSRFDAMEGVSRARACGTFLAT